MALRYQLSLPRLLKNVVRERGPERMTAVAVELDDSALSQWAGVTSTMEVSRV